MEATDRVLSGLDTALRTLFGTIRAARPNPSRQRGAADAEAGLSDADRRLAGSLMRVNHVGEVCAQALYQAQAITAGTPELREQMLRASREETDHLAWTQERLEELGDRVSLLNPLWYAGAFAIGLVAGRLGDRASLGFVVETERQVEAHLAGHLDRLPAADSRSRRIVEQMMTDERSHAEQAERSGGAPLPAPARALMRLAARVMTTTAHRI